MSASMCRLVVSLVACSWLAAGCGSSKKVDLGGDCSLNSDCNSPLVCTFGKCHTACVQTRDCPLSQSCVMTANGAVCQLPDEVDCRTMTCAAPAICAVDYHCRTVCQTAANCTAGQVCVSNLCADTTDLDPNGQLPGSPQADSGVDAVVCPVGSETCPCYGNDTCNAGLTCASHLCVRLGTGGNSGTDAGTGTGGAIGGAGGNAQDGGGRGGMSAAGGTTGTGGAAGGGVAGQGSWVKIDSASPSPLQANAAVAYDPVLQRAVLFGGVTSCAQGSAALSTNRTWEWDGAGWTLQTPTGDVPSPRASIGMAFDRAHGEAIVHGGWTPPDNPQAGTYTYNLATHAWTYRGANLPNIGCYGIGYDTDAQVVRMFGGNIYSTFYRDVRSWNQGTQTWSSVSPAGPSARIAGWVYDQARHRFVMYGGASNWSGSVLTDTWEYDPTASTWQQTAITSNHPSTGGSMVYDPKRARVVMYNGETWEYDAGTHLWTEVLGANQFGVFTSAPAVFYDEKLEAILLVGGCINNTLQTSTWRYNPPTGSGGATGGAGGSGAVDGGASAPDGGGGTSGGSIPVSGLVAYYPFNGNSKDESGNGNDLVPSTALLVPDRFGRADSAFRFSTTSDGMLSQKMAGIAGIQPRTVSVWLRVVAVVAGAHFVDIGKKDIAASASNTSFGLATGIASWCSGCSDDMFMLWACGYDSDWRLVGVLQHPGIWEHHVLKYDGTTAYWYVNGARLSTTFAHTYQTADGTVAVGGFPSTVLPNADIDDIRIYNRALTDQEIAALYAEQP